MHVSALGLLRFVPAAALALAMTSTANADEFWFAEPQSTALEGEASGAVRGVLLREEAGRYVIRVVGGELQVPVDSVKRRVEEGLTVEDIERLESEQAEAAAAARRERERERAFTEASVTGDGVAVDAGVADAPRAVEPVLVERVVETIRVFDPVLGLIVERPIDDLGAGVPLLPQYQERPSDTPFNRMRKLQERIARRNRRLFL